MAGPTSTLVLSGALSLQQPNFPPSAAQSIGNPISETIYVGPYDAQSPTLTADGATAIPFPIGMTNCHYLQMKVQGGSKVDLTLTSADGTSQVIPVDDFIILKSMSVPYTAISVTRSTGVSTTITYVIAQHT